MKEISPNQMLEFAEDIERELARLEQLKDSITLVKDKRETMPKIADILTENIALKLHNFYMGCERIFQLIASELNSGLPSGYDGHKRLLERMAREKMGMPAVLRQETVDNLKEYLGFRHIVRNLYGYELEREKVDRLLIKYFAVWPAVDRDIREFIAWLRQLATQI